MWVQAIMEDLQVWLNLDPGIVLFNSYRKHLKVSKIVAKFGNEML